jgi:prepilin-type N-terminal cleavage/methylation domain-containing protein/prepilin-type processing-associated H-X9-DG protein
VAGFTLLELLTVIAIIGILAAILIPVVGSVRKSARNATCLSNLRQLGVAFYLYVGDNRGSIPQFSITSNPNMPTYRWGCYGGGYGSVTKPLNAYVGRTHQNNNIENPDVFTCPGDLALGGIDGSSPIYGWSGTTYGSSYVVSQTIYTPGYGVSSFRMTDVKSPSKLVLMGDMMMFAPSYGTWAITSWHGGSNISNVLLFDGHVKSLNVVSTGIPGRPGFGGNNGYMDADKTVLWINK